MRPRSIVRGKPLAVRAGASIAAIGAVLLAACAGSPPIRYHSLSAVPASGAARATYDGPAIEVASVQLPPALVRSELVRDTATGRFEIREFDHWAAPLPRLARQALAEDLDARLPAGKVVYPGASWPPAGAALEVDVLSFRIEDGVGTMVLSWSLRSTAVPPAAVRGAQLRLETPLADGGADATPRILNDLLARLAERIVADVAGRPAPP